MPRRSAPVNVRFTSRADFSNTPRHGSSAGESRDDSNVQGYLEERRSRLAHLAGFRSRWNKRFFLLQGTKLVIYRSPECAEHYRRPVREIACQGLLVHGDPADSCAFTIITKEGKSTCLRAGWAGARTLWLTAMRIHGAQVTADVTWSNANS